MRLITKWFLGVFISTRIYTPSTKEEHLFFAMWLKARISHFNPTDVQTVVCYRNDKIALVVGFCNAHYNRVEMCWACDDPRAVTRGNILTMLAIAYMPPLSKMAITGVQLRKNKRARRFVEGLGFKLEGVLRRAGPNGENLTVYSLLKDEYFELVKRYRPSLTEQAKELVNGRQ